MTRKHSFSPAEHFGIWTAHDGLCFWCRAPIVFADVTIDHVIPESLDGDPAAMQRVRTEYTLPPDFAINGYSNWVPAHARCNSSKGSTIFPSSPAMVKAIHDVARKAVAAARIAAAILTDLRRGRVLTLIQQALCEDLLTPEDVQALIPAVDASDAVAREAPPLHLTAHVRLVRLGFRVSRSPRVMLETTCSKCGKPTMVPFEPTPGKSVYCRDCF